MIKDIQPPYCQTPVICSRKGVTRIVFLIGNYAIKIPNFTFSHQNFLCGMNANWSERVFTKKFKPLPEFYNLISPTLFCSWFGFLSIQKRVKILTLNDFEKFKKTTHYDELLQYQNICKDWKKENLGILKGKVVCIDYA